MLMHNVSTVANLCCTVLSGTHKGVYKLIRELWCKY